jgi:hypothetical protein
MKIKYVDQTDQMKDIGKIDVDIEFYEGVELNDKIIKNCWKIFIDDILKLRFYAYKHGIDEYYIDTMKFSMISDSKRKIDTSWDMYLDYKNVPSYVRHPRTCYLKLPYLYRDLEKKSKYIFPTFMKSVYTKSGDIKLEQVAGFGKVLINSVYFPHIKSDLFVNKRKNQKLKKSKINTIELFLDTLMKNNNKDFSNTEFIVMLDKYSDINSEYYVYNIVKDNGNSNFYDDILEKEDVWKFMYYKIVNSELNCFQDYKSLLNEIVLKSQNII